jgi:hypothetical protein
MAVLRPDGRRADGRLTGRTAARTGNVGCFVGSATTMNYRETRSTRRGGGRDQRSSFHRSWAPRSRRLHTTCATPPYRRGSTVVFRRPMSRRGQGTRWRSYSRSTPSVSTADRSCSGSVYNARSVTARRSGILASIWQKWPIMAAKSRQTSDARTKAPILFRQVGALFWLLRRGAPGGIHP